VEIIMYGRPRANDLYVCWNHYSDVFFSRGTQSSSRIGRSIMYISVENVKPVDGYRLLIKFVNGEERIFDVSPYLNIGRFVE